MEVLSIINGVTDKEMHEDIERFSFLEGFLTCSLEDYLSVSSNRNRKSVLLYIDVQGIDKLKEDVIKVIYMQCPIILISSCQKETEEIRQKYQSLIDTIYYPFSLRTFREYYKYYIEKYLLEKRTMLFGELSIDKGQRKVSMGGRTLDINGFEYEILMALVDNIGEVITREWMNQQLPKRKRTTLRNVDTHIKSIRKKVGITDMIQSVRSVGYYIPSDKFYQNLKKTYTDDTSLKLS